MNRTALAWLALTFTFASTALAQGGPKAVTPDRAVPVFVLPGNPTRWESIPSTN